VRTHGHVAMSAIEYAPARYSTLASRPSSTSNSRRLSFW
jgi:hypothetical protein